MNAYMTPERQQYIRKLKAQIETIDSILNTDSGTVISDDQKNRMRELRTEAKNMRKKLENNEFEIAIVGMEKAGKSTFANALMENCLLPTKGGRCTFTSTRIEYSGGRGDSATVSFYTTDELNKDFKNKLKTLIGVKSEKYSFDTLSEAVYDSLYKDVPDAEKKAYDNIHQDILAIVRNVDAVRQLLDNPPIEFTDQKFRAGDYKEYITDEVKARVVKSVIIRSSELKKMDNAIIFDVPGFNSPTELHKIQTRERMKDADAIIVVSSGVSPSLTGESLTILNEADDEGNPLRDKLFVFANRTEEASDIRESINVTYKEWCGKGYVPQCKQECRIVFGSAKAHLQNKGMDFDTDTKDRVLRTYREREKQMPHGDGIEKIRSELEAYNNNERFGVLMRRVDRIYADILKVFRDIQKNCADGADGRTYDEEQLNQSMLFYREVQRKGEEALLELKKNMREEMEAPEKKPLSDQISSYISSEVTPEKFGISSVMIEQLKKANPFMNDVDIPSIIESKAREKKFYEMYKDFSENVIGVANSYHAGYFKDIVDKLLEAMGADGSPYREELRQQLVERLSRFRGELASAEEGSGIYYQSLIERFSRDLYEVLITSPYGDEVRLNKFYSSIDNFFSMSVFYKQPDAENDLSYISTAPEDQPLCKMILFHHYFNARGKVQELVNELVRISGVVDIPEDVRRDVEKAFSAVSGQVGRIVDKATEMFANIGKDKTVDFRLMVLRNAISAVVGAGNPCSITDRKGFRKYYTEYYANRLDGEPYSIEDVCHGFDEDINILQDVLLNAFVHAVSMETPFIARETKSIDDIIRYIQDDEEFAGFLSGNYWKIKYEETALMDQRRRRQEQNRAIMAELNRFLSQLQSAASEVPTV